MCPKSTLVTLNQITNLCNPTEQQTYLQQCQHPEIQALQPDTENTEGVWIPTAEQLQHLLQQKLLTQTCRFSAAPRMAGSIRPIFANGAADYGTYIDTHRQFMGSDAESVLLRALMALLGIGERWMV